MARALRITFPGAFYHITSGGNERKAVFKSERDQEKFLEYLESATFTQVCRQLCREFVASLDACLSQVHPQISSQGDRRVGGCTLGANQLFVHHALQITLQASTVDFCAEPLEVLDGQLTVLYEKTERFSLSIIQPMLLYQHITADDLFATPADLYHLRFQTGSEIIEPAGHVHIVFAYVLD